MCLADVVQGIVVLRFLRLFPQPRQEVNEAPVQKRDALEFGMAGALCSQKLRAKSIIFSATITASWLDFCVSLSRTLSLIKVHFPSLSLLIGDNKLAVTAAIRTRDIGTTAFGQLKLAARWM